MAEIIYDLGELDPFDDVVEFLASPQYGFGWFLEINTESNSWEPVYWDANSEVGSRSQNQWHRRYVYRRRTAPVDDSVDLPLQFYAETYGLVVNEPHTVQDYSGTAYPPYGGPEFTWSQHREAKKIVTFDGVLLKWDELRIIIDRVHTVTLEVEYRKQFSRGYFGQVIETEAGTEWAEGAYFEDIGFEYSYYSGYHF